MVDPSRARRLAKRIAAIVASAIEYDIKDPRLTGVTITDAKVTPDLHDATLYYTVMGTDLTTEPNYDEVAFALEKATGILRSKVGAGTGVRFTPTLTFIRDQVPDVAFRMEQLINKVRAADEQLEQLRQYAVPVGEADPYRHKSDPDQSDLDQDDE